MGTLNLRDSLPVGIEAERRAEAWLRERQATGLKEVLVITGRGNASIGGVPIIRETVSKLLRRLQRAGVVKAVQEHTAGSFVVELASMRAMLEAPKRRKDPAAPLPDPPGLDSLAPQTRAMLRALAERNLDALGIVSRAGLVEAEMVQQFSRI